MLTPRPFARRRAAAEAASRRRSQVAQQQSTQSATAAAEHSIQTQLATLRSELVQQHGVTRDAMIEFVVKEFEALSKELRIDVERQIKRRQAELEEFETKFAALRMPRIRGTYVETQNYLAHDVAIRGGSSYIARKDGAGVCPGPDWQQICMVGKTGQKGERGFAGARGPQGESGATFLCWKIDRKNFVAIPLMTNGKEGPRLYLRELFEEYHNPEELVAWARGTPKKVTAPQPPPNRATKTILTVLARDVVVIPPAIWPKAKS
jgi:hypothetical protein